MKSGPVLFLGLFAAVGASWAAVVMGSDHQIGSLAPYYDDTEGQAYPAGFPGGATRGESVYRDLNCASCHTQQVRREGFGDDEARGWGTRQSVARDYIFQAAPQLGDSRNGPDLANLSLRKPAPTRADLMRLLYQGRGGMPGYAFLFRREKVVGEVSDQALAASGGYEIVPTARADSLADYLMSLGSSYDYPEARPAPAAAGEGGK